MIEAILQVLAVVIALGIIIVLGQRFGYSTLPKSLPVGGIAMFVTWFIVWLAFDQLTIFDKVFRCGEEYIPLIGKSKVCDYHNIPLIIGIIVGVVVMMAFIDANKKRKADNG